MHWIFWLLIVLAWSSDAVAQSTRVGGDIQYSEDSPHVSGDKGTMAGVVQQTADTALSGNGDRSFMQIDENGFLKINLKALSVTIAGEDVSNDLLKVEERYTTMPVGGSTPKIAADQLYKTGAGLVRSLTCFSDATATAGTIAVLDSTTAGAGTKIYEFDVLAVAYNTPWTVELNVAFSVGLYLDFTTTADMQCTLRYR